MSELYKLNEEFTALLEEIAERINNMLFHEQITKDFYSYEYEQEHMKEATKKLKQIAKEIRELEATQ